MVRLREPDRPAVDVSDTATPGGRCPACGEPLFAWLDPLDMDPRVRELRHVLDRCENCGLALEREDGGEGAAAMIERLERQVAERGEASFEGPNAASFQAGLGTESWSELRLPAEPAVMTPRALELLLGHEHLEVAELGFPARRGMAAMFQTILNLLTFNRNFAPAALRGELRPRDSRAGPVGFGIDALVTVFTAIPVAAIAVAMEGVAILARRGGVIRATVRRRD
ncbi:MAG: hypothetical protein ACXWD7_06515 [Solirubrobacterales bacterium]